MGNKTDSFPDSSGRLVSEGTNTTLVIDEALNGGLSGSVCRMLNVGLRHIYIWISCQCPFNTVEGLLRNGDKSVDFCRQCYNPKLCLVNCIWNI